MMPELVSDVNYRLSELRRREKSLEAKIRLSDDELSELEGAYVESRERVKNAFDEALRLERSTESSEAAKADAIQRHDDLVKVESARRRAYEEAKKQQAKLNSQLQWVRDQIEELMTLSIGVDIEDGEITSLDDMSVRFDDSGYVAILRDLVVRSDCQDFMVHEITTVARAIAIVKNLDSPAKLKFMTDRRFEQIILDYLPNN